MITTLAIEEGRLRSMMLEVVSGNGRVNILRREGKMVIPKAWFEALEQLLASHPDLQTDSGRFCLWQVAVFSREAWLKVGLRPASERPLRRTLRVQELDLGMEFSPDLIRRLRTSS